MVGYFIEDFSWYGLGTLYVVPDELDAEPYMNILSTIKFFLRSGDFMECTNVTSRPTVLNASEAMVSRHGWKTPSIAFFLPVKRSSESSPDSNGSDSGKESSSIDNLDVMEEFLGH